MISKISPNFAGQVKIGRNREERRKIIAALKEVPSFNRKDFGTSLVALKSAIEANTPVDSKYLINVSSFNNGYLAGTKISVTDEKSNKHLALDGVLKIFNGEPVSIEQYDKDMKCAFQTLTLDTIYKSKEHFPNKSVNLDKVI